MKLIASSLLIAAVLALPVSADSPPVEAPTVTPAELQARRESGTAPVVIDVRSAAEFATGHIPGAVNIPFDEVAERISEVDAPNGVALYCMVGPRARKGEAALLASGYVSVLHIEGGLAAWKADGLPVEGAAASKPE
jgi:phage shock protein E